MKNFEVNVCELVSGLVEFPVSSLAEICTGKHLANILHNIDSGFFPLDKSLNDWDETKFIIDRFLLTKGLPDKSIEFAIEELRGGDLASLISSLFQLFTLIALFNPRRWSAVTTQLDANVMSSIGTVLDSMIEEASERLELTDKLPKSEDKTEVSAMLRKLEWAQQQIEESERKVQALKSEVLTEKEENNRKQQLIDKQRAEIRQIKQWKDDVVYQMEVAIPHDYKLKEAEQSAKIAALAAELSETKEKLAPAIKEIDMLRQEYTKQLALIDNYKERQRQFDELSSQLSYYKNIAENLKVEREISDAKIKGYEVMERRLRETLDQLQTEKNNLNSAKLANSQLQNKVEMLLKRLNFSEEKAKLIRKQSITNMERYNEVTRQLSFIQELEEQNLRMKNVLTRLLKVKDLDGLHKLQEKVRKEQLVAEGPNSDFLKTNFSMPELKYECDDVCKSFVDEIHLQSPAATSPVSSLHKIVEVNSVGNDSDGNSQSFLIQPISLSKVETSLLEPMLRQQSFYKDLYPVPTPVSNDGIQLLYSAMISWYGNNLAGEHVQLPSNKGHLREILKPFPLDNILNQLTF